MRAMTTELKPIFRWAGGKRKLAARLSVEFPKKMDSYGETFAGGAALLLELINQDRLNPGARILLRDQGVCLKFWRCMSSMTLARDLRMAYESARESTRKLFEEGEKGFAYREAADNMQRCLRDDAYTANGVAWFLIVNQLCFNGLWRVNSVGKFNVPLDKDKGLPRDMSKEFTDLAIALARYEVTTTSDLDAFLELKIQNQYYDPPYHGTFCAYSREPFEEQEQRVTAWYARKMVEHGCLVVASNSDTPLVRELYKGFSMGSVGRKNTMSSKASTRSEVRGELIMVGGGET